MASDYRDAEWLERRYHGDGRTRRGIAEGCDVSPRTIRKPTQKHGIGTREVASENHPLYGKERSDDVKRIRSPRRIQQI